MTVPNGNNARGLGNPRVKNLSSVKKNGEEYWFSLNDRTGVGFQ